MISNHPDFSAAQTVPVSSDGIYAWTLLADGPANGERTVYAKFVAPNADNTTLTADVKLDRKAPVMSTPRVLRQTQSVEHGPHGVYLEVPDADAASKVSYIQFAHNKTHPWPWTTYTNKPSIWTTQQILWVHTADAAGNVSRWQRIGFPKKAVSTTTATPRRYGHGMSPLAEFAVLARVAKASFRPAPTRTPSERQPRSAPALAAVALHQRRLPRGRVLSDSERPGAERREPRK